MAYDEDLAQRIRARVASQQGLTEKRMFGGLAFLIEGNMAIAASGQGGILVRVGPERSEHLAAARQLGKWVDLGVGFARSLPAKG